MKPTCPTSDNILDLYLVAPLQRTIALLENDGYRVERMDMRGKQISWVVYFPPNDPRGPHPSQYTSKELIKLGNYSQADYDASRVNSICKEVK